MMFNFLFLSTRL